jgi:hypothetical protein
VSLERVVRNVQRRLEWVVQTGCRKHSKKAETGGYWKGLLETLKEGRNESSEQWVVGNVQRRLEQVVGTGRWKCLKKDRTGHQKRSKKAWTGPWKRSSETFFNEGWNASSLRIVGKIQKRLERIIVGGAGDFGKECSEKDRTGHQKRSKKA